MDARHELGKRGEEEASQYLQNQGLPIEDRHFQTRWGEIDLICRDKDTWVFVEVKTRTDIHSPSAADAITPSKQDKLVRAALSYLKKRSLNEENVRFDVVLIEAGSIEWIRNAFEPSSRYTF